jgi:branched-chain amino acid transport system ATP-binding protein
MLLNVDKIKVTYKEFIALRNISLRVDQGQIAVVLGSNGAGKSTLLKSIASLLAPVEGSISFQAERIDGIGSHEVVRRGISLVPEGKQIFAKMSVFENLLLGCYTQKDPKIRHQTMDGVFELFPRLQERRTQRAGTLSGGEQQMLAIARGLMSRPKLLMLDEPSLGIAPKLVTRIFETIQTIRSSGLTILLVEQHVQEAMEISDQAYILQTGNVALEGQPQELLNSDLVRKTYLGM